MTTPTNSTNPFAPSVSTPLCSPNRSPLTENPELDEDMMREMTASYSEISQSCSSIEDDKTEKGADRQYCDLQDFSLLEETRGQPNEFFTNLDGTVEKEGDNLVYIAQDLESKLKLSSPTADKSLLPDAGIVKTLIESNVLNNIETEASRIAHSVDMLTENLVSVLESISAITVECLETYRDSVSKTCEIQDANIKAMYQLMAKCEQLAISIQPVQKLAQQVKEVRRLIDLFEDACNL
ncbi:hypothetical protein M8J76_002615 [Diaphorina citri]|nr:hypothetical protein M8J75_009442 [Diaphorina citri]KAI5729445.1 hypothetical protein M8J76_002615 [Diaphorina citri]